MYKDAAHKMNMGTYIPVVQTAVLNCRRLLPWWRDPAAAAAATVTSGGSSSSGGAAGGASDRKRARQGR